MNNRIKASLKDGCRLLLSHKVWFGGSIASSITIVYFISNCFEISLKLALCALIVLYILTFIIIVIYCYNNYCSESDNNANPLFIVMNFEKDVQKVLLGTQSIDKALQRICDSTKCYFDKVCGVHSSVSIKVNACVPECAKIEDVKVENVCRDWESANQRDIKQYSRLEHYVVKNTAYMHIVNMLNEGKNDVYYINNEISKTVGYNTTSREAYPNHVLPYESEWVFPIISLYETPDSEWNMKGFFCIDSKEANSFHRNEEVATFVKLVCSGLNRII